MPKDTVNVFDYSELRGLCSYVRDSYDSDSWHNPIPTALNTTRVFYEELVETDNAQPSYRKTGNITVNTYLRPFDMEQPNDFTERRKHAVYINLTKPIIDTWVDSISSGISRNTGELDTFLQSVGWNKSYQEFFQNVVRDALMFSLCFVFVDGPVAVASSKAQQKELNYGPRLIKINPTQIAWLGTDEDGNFTELAWIDSPFFASGDVVKQTIRLRILSRNQWAVYEGKTQQFGLGVRQEIAAGVNGWNLVDSGELPSWLDGSLPVVPVVYQQDCALSYPKGSSLVRDTADYGRAIFNLMSQINQVHLYSSAPLLVIGTSDRGVVDPKSQRTIGTRNALVYDSAGGQPVYLQPSSESTKEMRDHIGFLTQLAYRSVGLEVSVDNSAQVQSGEALRVRARDFESRCKKFSETLRRTEVQVLKLMQNYLGLNDELSITYPTRYTLPDNQLDMALALSVLKDVPLEIGSFAKKEALAKILSSALGLTDEQLTKAMDEIDRIMQEDVQTQTLQRQALNDQYSKKG